MALIPITARAVELAEIGLDARDFIAACRSESTDRSYRLEWEQFTAWCDTHGLDALPASPETVALYVTVLAKSARHHRPAPRRYLRCASCGRRRFTDEGRGRSSGPSRRAANSGNDATAGQAGVRGQPAGDARHAGRHAGRAS